MYKVIAIIAMGLITASCGGGCTANLERGVYLKVFDGNSETNLCGVTGMLIDGEYLEDIIISDRSPCYSYADLAYERPGHYQIILEKEGYKTWTSEEFDVAKGYCHVQTVYIKANMEKL